MVELDYIGGVSYGLGALRVWADGGDKIQSFWLHLDVLCQKE